MGYEFSLPDDTLGKITTPQAPFEISCECKPEDVDKVKKAIYEVIHDFIVKGPKQDEIERIQNRGNLEFNDALKNVGGRHTFFDAAVRVNKSPRKILNLANRFYDANRARELLKMVIKPDKFIEMVDIPKKQVLKNNITPFSVQKPVQKFAA